MSIKKLVLGTLMLVGGILLILVDVLVSLVVGIVLIVGALLVLFLKNFSLEGEVVSLEIWPKSYKEVPLLTEYRGYAVYSSASINKHVSSHNKLRLSDNTGICFYGDGKVASGIWVGLGCSQLYVFDNKGKQVVYPKEG